MDVREINVLTGEETSRDYFPAEIVVPTFPEKVEAKREAVRQKRWELETGGFLINGVSMKTDEASQAKFERAVSYFDTNQSATEIDFEPQVGVFETLTKADVIKISKDYSAYYQALRSHARSLDEAIAAAADDTELDAIDIETGWPAQS